MDGFKHSGSISDGRQLERLQGVPIFGHYVLPRSDSLIAEIRKPKADVEEHRH
jgi:hypothetical protein